MSNGPRTPLHPKIFDDLKPKNPKPIPEDKSGAYARLRKGEGRTSVVGSTAAAGKAKSTNTKATSDGGGGGGGGGKNTGGGGGGKNSGGDNKGSGQGNGQGDYGGDGGASAYMLAFGGIVMLGAWLQGDLEDTALAKETTFQKFRNEVLAAGEVERLEVVGTTVNVFLRDGSPLANGVPYGRKAFYFTIGSVEHFERSLENAQRNLGVIPRDFVPLAHSAGGDSLLWDAFTGVAPVLLIGGVIYYFLRRGMGGAGGAGGGGGGGGPGGIFSFGKARIRQINKETGVRTTFDDVAGLDEAKLEIEEFVQFLKAPDKYRDLGAKIPKGALLTGPPGTGKTLLAKATAGEASVPFLSISGSEFLEMFVGVGPSRVRDLFEQARKSAPCIVFVDEIDAIGRKRGRQAMGGNDERENTLNQLLVEMDGFTPSDGVVIFAATNREDVLDPALLRPGRFDRKIVVDAADIKGRRDIFKVHLGPLVTSADKDEVAKRMATLTPGFSGADIANVCNEAALIAARLARDKIDLDGLSPVFDLFWFWFCFVFFFWFGWGCEGFRGRRGVTGLFFGGRTRAGVGRSTNQISSSHTPPRRDNRL